MVHKSSKTISYANSALHRAQPLVNMILLLRNLLVACLPCYHLLRCLYRRQYLCCQHLCRYSRRCRSLRCPQPKLVLILHLCHRHCRLCLECLLPRVLLDKLLKWLHIPPWPPRPLLFQHRLRHTSLCLLDVLWTAVMLACLSRHRLLWSNCLHAPGRSIPQLKQSSFAG